MKERAYVFMEGSIVEWCFLMLTCTLVAFSNLTWDEGTYSSTINSLAGTKLVISEMQCDKHPVFMNNITTTIEYKI